MSVAVPNGDYIVLNGFQVFWHADQPERIHMATNDPSMTDEHGEKPGLRVVFSSNPASADYNPGNFNRLARLLADNGKNAPHPAPLGSRRLRDR